MRPAGVAGAGAFIVCAFEYLRRGFRTAGWRRMAQDGLVWHVWFRFGRGLIARLAGADQHLGQARPPMEEGATIPAANHGRAHTSPNIPQTVTHLSRSRKRLEAPATLFFCPRAPLHVQKRALLAVA